jgi:uncharacterized membrane protein
MRLVKREEAAIWRLRQQRGKTQFLLRATLLFAALLLLLINPLLRLHFRCETSHKAAILVLSYTGCLLLSYLHALLAWRHGQRLTNQTPAEPTN